MNQSSDTRFETIVQLPRLHLFWDRVEFCDVSLEIFFCLGQVGLACASSVRRASDLLERFYFLLVACTHHSLFHLHYLDCYDYGVPGICSQRKKTSLPQMDQTPMFNTPKSILMNFNFSLLLSISRLVLYTAFPFPAIGCAIRSSSTDLRWSGACFGSFNVKSFPPSI